MRPSAIPSSYLPYSVFLLSHCSEAASAAALALAAIASRPEGRRAVRAAGGIPPLAALLGEGLDSSPAASAALALASCAVDDECKVRV